MNLKIKLWRTPLAVGLLMILVAVAFKIMRFPHRLDASPSSAAPSTAAKTNVLQRGPIPESGPLLWNSLFSTPISLYGKVVDQNGNSIADADLDITFTDREAGDGTEYHEKTDGNGKFHITGHGLSVNVISSKAGYYHLDSSDGTFSYAKQVGVYFGPHVDPGEPAVLILRKAGKIEPLVTHGIGGALDKNGVPVELDLWTGEHASPGQGNIKFELWTDDQKMDSNYRFDWRLRITVQGAGLVERSKTFDFEAPTDGYRQSVEIDMPQSLGYKWQNSISRDYFLKLANGSYGRIQLSLGAWGGRTFSGLSIINPQPGSRNLEAGENPDDE